MTKFEDSNFIFKEQESILKYIFQYFFITVGEGENQNKIVDDYYLNSGISTKEYKLIKKILTVKNDIAKIVNEYSYNWKFKRFGNYEKTLLLYGLYNLLYDKKYSHKIVIWFSVENAKKYCGESSYKIINAILNKSLNQ